MGLRTAGNRLKTTDTRTAKPPPKEAAPFYLSPEWRQLIASIVRQRGRRCEECGKTHGPDGLPVRIFGDHIIELKDGGAPLDPRNIRLLDGACHSKKTAKARAKRMGLA